MLKLLLALQAFHVAFLLLHDWIPLGRFNNIAAVRQENPGNKLWITTVLSTLPYALGVWLTVQFMRSGHPHRVFLYLWIAYGMLFFGELNAWWLPYFFGTKPGRIARYKSMFGGTHALLPARNGIEPNTLHVLLHLATLALLIVLALLP